MLILQEIAVQQLCRFGTESVTLRRVGCRLVAYGLASGDVDVMETFPIVNLAIAAGDALS